MKKLFLLMYVTLMLSQTAIAQQKLWTVLSNGGTINSTATGTYGVIIVYDPVANTWTSKHAFLKAEGTPPTGAPVIASDGNLYGTCNDNGGNGFGSVWKYDIANSTFTVLHHFNSTTGRYPHGNLIQAANGKLYGVTEQQGANNKGTLFELNISTGVVTKLVDFSATNGYQAFSKLIEAAPGKLLGVTLNGGTNNNGVLYEYDYTNNIYTKKIDLNASTTGSIPWGDLIKAPNGKFYGMTSAGGANSIGVLYEYDYSTNTITIKQNFTTTTTGSSGKGGLVIAEDGFMYGMTELNGVNNKGTLFQYDYVNNIFSKKVDFSGTANGAAANASLTENNGKLYGMTPNGGTNNTGVIFEYDYASSTFTKKQDFNSNSSFGSGFPFMSSFALQNCPSVTVSTQPANATVCTSGTTQFSIGASGGTLTYQWQIKTGGGGYSNLSDNTTYSGVTNDTLTVSATSALNGYYYRCVVTSSTCSSYSNAGLLTVNSNPAIVPSVSIAVTTGNSAMCAGNPITLTATPTNGGTPSYQWKVDGTNVGTNSNTYSPSSPANGTAITCVMLSNALCANNASANSNSISMNVTAKVTPSLTIGVTSGNSITCAGTPVQFTATPTNGGSPTYQWKVNGANIGVPSSTSTFSSTTLNNSDVVTCVLASDITCVTSSTATSNSITMNISANLTPSVSIAITSGSNNTCPGNPVPFKATPTNGGSSPGYQWKINGGNIGVVSSASTFSSSTLNNTDVVTCELTSNVTCVTSTTATSNSITMNVGAPLTPTVSIAITAGNSTTCSGNQIIFTATTTNGGSLPTYQWKINSVNTGAASSVTTFSSSTLNNSDAVTCELTSNAACVTSTTAASNSITMNVTTSVTPAISVAITSGNSTMCAGSPISFGTTITNGGTIPQYKWKINGSDIGISSSSYNTSLLNNSDVVTCELTSDITCLTAATVVSNSTIMQVTANATPSVTIAVTAGSSTTCSGKPVNFTATPTNEGNSPSYIWKVDGINAGTNVDFTSSTLTNGAVVTCDLTSNATCLTSSNATSLGTTMNVAQTPTAPTITPDVNMMTLSSSSTSGNQWYLNGSAILGETNQVIHFIPGGSYTVQFSNGTCTSESLPYVYNIQTGTYASTLSTRILIYPNPSQGVFNISLKDQVAAVVTVKDIYGTNLYSGSLNGTSSEIDLSDLDKGIYFIHVADGAEEGVVKIILN